MYKEIKDLAIKLYIKAIVKKCFVQLDSIMYLVNIWTEPTTIIKNVESFKCEMLDLLKLTRNEIYKS